MRYTNLQIVVIILVMLLSIIAGACVPIVAGELDAKAQTGQVVVIEYIGGNSSGYDVNLWRVVDLQYRNVCYISSLDTECVPMR